MIDRCSLFYSKRSDSNKIMKSYGHKCQHQALLKVGTLKANKQPQDELMRHLSSGTQSSPLATTHDGLRRSFSPAHQMQLDEGTNYTRASMKKRRDKRSRLSDTMRAQLGP
ncbi:hypothetical protein CK203_104999 [Vitis vinifera]|uniref:Uncharacterized protein n=1 Tax=Vitis vinifera TaxID=29760 RepID=A0A438CWU3_VITVI|nr:hypothetical protein CK203_104999 [Vitis vinifera]